MKRIYNIASSLVQLYGWIVLRLDIQRVENRTLGDCWYTGLLVIETKEGERVELIIRDSGDFEIRD